MFEHVSRGSAFRDERTFYRFTQKRQVVIMYVSAPSGDTVTGLTVAWFAGVCVRVCSGGGFAGSKAAQMLEREPYMEVTLIDSKPFFQCTPSLPASLVDPAAVQKISAAHTSVRHDGKSRDWVRKGWSEAYRVRWERYE